ncbi:uncharacterized protein DDB_G0284459-like [Ylistrum balloti]|uniref:uncharacterized protein DDB_G0284459-like n=1 Tax=Ylistrum balloti TaxID=509963 RepID=UPI002905A3B8|nr:uncharacterized protein DDB_G0284459-like [Ylistrum balloti]
MSSDVSGSPGRPRKITLADFIQVKRTNPHVNFDLRSRPLTPHNGVSSVQGSQNNMDTHSSTTDKTISNTSNRRDSSRTYSSDDQEDEKEAKGEKNRRHKRAVFASDGQGQRESAWKSESVRRIRMSTIIQKSRDSSAKTTRTSNLDSFNDSRSGYSLDVMSTHSTKHRPNTRESKRSRRGRGSRGDKRQTSHTPDGSDVHRQTRDSTTQTPGESRACQTSPILYSKTDGKKSVMEEVKSQPITEVDDEFDYPLSQLLAEYPYNPKTKETETKVTESKTIDIDIQSSNDDGKKIYDADGTIIVVTASSQINARAMLIDKDKGDDSKSVAISEQEKPDTGSETKDENHIDNRRVFSDPSRDKYNQSGNLSGTDEPAEAQGGKHPKIISNADSLTMSNTVLSLDKKQKESPSDQVNNGLIVPPSSLDSLQEKPIGEGFEQMDECAKPNTIGNAVLGVDNKLAPDGASLEIRSDVEPATEKITAASLPPYKDDNVDKQPPEKCISVDSTTTTTENIELERKNSVQISSKTSLHENNGNDPSHGRHSSSEFSQAKDKDVGTLHKTAGDGSMIDTKSGLQKKDIHTTGQELHNEKSKPLNVKRNHPANTSSSISRKKLEMEKSQHDKEKEKRLLGACKKELSDEVQLGKAVLNVIQMWKDSAVVRSLKDQQTKRILEDETENGNSSSSCQWSDKTSETEEQLPSRGSLSKKKDNESTILKTASMTHSQQKQIQIVIRNPGRNDASNKESAVKIVIKLPNDPHSQSSVSTPDVAEAKVGKPINGMDETDHDKHVEIPETHEQETPEISNEETKQIPVEGPEDIPDQEPETVPDQEPPSEVIKETQMVLPPVKVLAPSEKDRSFKRLKHVKSGKRRTSFISVRQATVTTASVRMREVDGVFCSNKGVYIGHDRKLYNTFKDASQTSRVDQILENFKEMRNGNIGKPEFLYDQANDEIFQTHLDSFRRGNSKSKVNGSVVMATSKLYGQARTRKAKAYSNLHKKLTNTVNY